MAYQVTPEGTTTTYVFSAAAASGFAVGDTVTVSATVQMPAGCLFSLAVHVLSTNRYLPGNSYSNTATGEAQRVSVTVTLTEPVDALDLDASLVYHNAQNLPPDPSQVGYMGDVLIGPASDYFDGDTADADGYVYGWDGDPGLSTSYKAQPLIVF